MPEDEKQAPPPGMHPSFVRVINQRKEIKEKLKGIKHRIGVYSAKGGVGKTTVSVNLAYTLAGMGLRVGLLDADIDCPNLTMFLGHEKVVEADYPLRPIDIKGVKVLSTAMLVDDTKKPIIWRGPLIGKMITEFFNMTEWGELDYLVVDCPPGTSDSPLSIMQLLELDGFVLVTTPQRIAAVNAIRSGMMAKRMGVAVLGVVENMSDGKAAGGEEVAKTIGCGLVGTVKSNRRFNELSDSGKVPVIEDAAIKEEFLSIVKKLGIGV